VNGILTVWVVFDREKYISLLVNNYCTCPRISNFAKIGGGGTTNLLVDIFWTESNDIGAHIRLLINKTENQK